MLAGVRVLRFLAGIALEEDELKDVDSFFAKLRRERRHEPRVWVARVACALGVAVVGLGVNWLVGFVLAAFVLLGKRPRRLAYVCLFGALLAAALFVDGVVAGVNLYLALAVYGLPAALFVLGFVLVLTTGVTVFRGSLAVRRLRREHDVEGLIAQLTAADPVTRAKAADALAPLADPRAEQPLLEALADPDLDVRTNAARALGALKSGAAVEPLIRALGDEDGDLRFEAAWALGQIGDPRAIEPLRRVLSDQEVVVQDAARDALKSLGAGAAVQTT